MDVRMLKEKRVLAEINLTCFFNNTDDLFEDMVEGKFKLLECEIDDLDLSKETIARLQEMLTTSKEELIKELKDKIDVI